jgi:alcohol dehydrogenase
MLSDLALVPYAEAMLVPLPQAVAPAIVPSAADNMTDGWRAVAPALGKLPAADVLVVGGGGMRSIPLYAVDTALALGAASVTYVDTDPDRLAVAQQLGAKVVEGNPGRSLGAFPITVDGTGTPDGLVATLRLTDYGGGALRSASSYPKRRCPYSSSTPVGCICTSAAPCRAPRYRRFSTLSPLGDCARNS